MNAQSEERAGRPTYHATLCSWSEVDIYGKSPNLPYPVSRRYERSYIDIDNDHLLIYRPALVKCIDI